MFAQPANEWGSERKRERAGGTKEATVHVPSTKHSLACAQLRGKSSRVFQVSEAEVWHRQGWGQTQAAWQWCWYEYHTLSGKGIERTELAEENVWMDMHMWIWGWQAGLQTSEAQIMGSWARRLLRLRVRAALLSGLSLCIRTEITQSGSVTSVCSTLV